MVCPKCHRPLPQSFFAPPPVPFGGPRLCQDCRRRERDEADAVKEEWAALTTDVGGEGGA